MRLVFILGLLLFSAFCQSETLVTNKYEATVTQLCEEGAVVCDNVVLNLIDNVTGDKLRIGGETLHTKCADGITPCAFQGYVFTTSKNTYRILSKGQLQIFDKRGELIFSERGNWL